MRGSTRLILGAATALLVLSCSKPEPVTVKDPGTYVVDTANIIDAGVEAELERWLGDLERQTTAQVKVLTVRTIEGEDWFGFVQRHAELWKLGQKEKDNGALIAVTVQERKVRIHTGDGLEGVLPDSWCGSASREVAGAHFKKEQYSEGIRKLTTAVVNEIAADAGVTLGGVSSYRYQPSGGQTSRGRQPRGARTDRRSRHVFCCSSGLFPLFVLLMIVSTLFRRRRHYGAWGGGFGRALFWGMLFGGGLGRGRSSWGGGFGGGSGGFGGGSFGGGGSFSGGGGGASW